MSELQNLYPDISNIIEEPESTLFINPILPIETTENTPAIDYPNNTPTPAITYPSQPVTTLIPAYNPNLTSLEIQNPAPLDSSTPRAITLRQKRKDRSPIADVAELGASSLALSPDKKKERQENYKAYYEAAHDAFLKLAAALERQSRVAQTSEQQEELQRLRTEVAAAKAEQIRALSLYQRAEQENRASQVEQTFLLAKTDAALKFAADKVNESIEKFTKFEKDKAELHQQFNNHLTQLEAFYTNQLTEKQAWIEFYSDQATSHQVRLFTETEHLKRIAEEHTSKAGHLERELNHSQQHIQLLQNQLQQKNIDLSVSQQKLDTATNISRELEDKVANLSQQNNTLQSELTQLHTNHSQLTNQINFLQSNWDNAQQKYLDLDNQSKQKVDDLNAQILNLQTDLLLLQQQDAVTKQPHPEQVNFQTLESQIETLITENKRLSDDNKYLSSELHSLQGKYSTLVNQQHDDLDSSIRSTKKFYSEETERYNTAKAHYETVINQKEAEIQDHLRKISSLERHVETTNSLLRSQQQTSADLQQNTLHSKRPQTLYNLNT